MTLKQGLQTRWNQFKIETEFRLAGFMGLIVNLHYARNQPERVAANIVLVETWCESCLLALLRALTVLPRHKVYVIRRSEDVSRVVAGRNDGALIFVAGSLYTKRYQAILEYDLKPFLIIF